MKTVYQKNKKRKIKEKGRNRIQIQFLLKAWEALYTNQDLYLLKTIEKVCFIPNISQL